MQKPHVQLFNYTHTRPAPPKYFWGASLLIRFAGIALVAYPILNNRREKCAWVLARGEHHWLFTHNLDTDLPGDPLEVEATSYPTVSDAVDQYRRLNP
jgi:hypothetical protein